MPPFELRGEAILFLGDSSPIVNNFVHNFLAKLCKTLANDLTGQGSNDYRLWTDADRRIVRRKQLAAEFDNRLTEYFDKGRSAVLEGVR